MQTNKEIAIDNDETLLIEAETYFSSGMVEEIRATGRDVIEQGGAGAYLVDINGNRYIDCLNSSIYNLGRSNAAIISELQKAGSETDQGLFVTTSTEKVALGKALSEFVSGPLNGLLLQTTRGEPFDGACKIARGYSGRSELISLRGAWHGQTGFAVNLTERKDKDDFGSKIPDTKIVDPEELIESISNKTAAVIIEPVQAENHCRSFDPQFVQAVRKACDEAGTLLIFDETQTGFGRTGRKFAYEGLGVYPDILIFGEAVTNGVFPMAGMIYTDSIKQFPESAVAIHISTFGAHDVGCRVACKAIDEYSRVKPWDNARLMGGILIDALSDLVHENRECIESVKGEGLLVSLRMNSEDYARKFCKALKNFSVLASQGLLDKRTVIIRPVLTISSREMDELLVAIKNAIDSLSS